jgi:hypothetical protein
MAWTSPRTWVAGELVTAAIGNVHWRDNLAALRSGELALSSQAVGDIIYGFSATQLGRIAAIATGKFLRSKGVTTVPAYGTPWENYQTKTGAYTMLVTDDIVECTSGTFTVTLFTAVGNTGKQIIIKNTGTGTITIDGNASETIDGALTITLPQYFSYTLVSNGANWIIV